MKRCGKCDVRRLLRRLLDRLLGCTPEQVKRRQQQTDYWTE